MKSNPGALKSHLQFLIETRVTYVESESRPDSNYHFFSYRVRITNKSSTSAQLMSRHWIITDSDGQREEVRGAGVIGQQPKIIPGQTFEYQSACPLNTSSGSMKGTYQMVAEDGSSFDIEVPEFYLIAPNVLH
jgi:ApaG protein